MAVYKLSAWGQPVGMGATGAFHAQVSAICKRDGPQGEHYVANELVAAELGRILRLPVPPGFVIMDSTTAWFSSLNFNLTGVALPPIIPANFANTFPNETAALLAFDIFIANLDRYANNISADMTPSPKFNVFDHSHALLGSIAPPALAPDPAAAALADHYLETRDTRGIDLRPCESAILAQMKPKGQYNIGAKTWRVLRERYLGARFCRLSGHL